MFWTTEILSYIFCACALRKVYYVYVILYLMYGLQIWGGASESVAHYVTVLENQCIRIIRYLPSNLLPLCIDVIVPVITCIVNMSLNSCIFPKVIKFAVVKPLLKKLTLNSTDQKNYRPSSNLSFLSKLIKRIIANRKHISPLTIFLLNLNQHFSNFNLLKQHSYMYKTIFLMSLKHAILLLFDVSPT